jgi:hypothetical protein
MDNNKLDITIFNNEEVLYASLGQFKKEMVDFIISKKPEFNGRLQPDKDILFWKARVKHTNNHKKDFVSEEEFNKCVEDIPYIIQNPDYISIHPTDESVSFIKQYSEKVSVAIKISADGKLVYRTMYPLDEIQLKDYMDKGRAWKYHKND